ncbi:MAG: exosome complex protein Rrp42 [Candidatus Micrarchaeota archaeon]
MPLDELTRAFVKDLVKSGKREDGRSFLDFRNASVKTGVIENDEGSAIATMGDSKVLCGVKIDLLLPFPDRPDDAVVMVGSEFSPMAHPEFQPGPPNENSIELARVVDRAIRSADCIDLKALPRTKEKVMAVFIDLQVLDQCGNLIDTAALAAMAALKNTRVPRLDVENAKVVREDFQGPLPLKRSALICSFEKIGEKIVVDASDKEEVASDGRLSIGVTDDGLVCCGQKSGEAGFSKQELLNLIDLSFEKTKPLFELL